MRHTIKQAFLYITMASVVAAGCGDGFYSNDLGESHDSVHDPVSREFAISNGTLATESDNNTMPYAAAVRLDRCSGLKIGTRRFLSAAHCGFSQRVKSKMLVSNELDATDPDDMQAVTIKKVWVHPTYTWKSPLNSFFYDVALVDVEELTPHIPIFHHEKLPAESKDGEQTWLISYGTGQHPFGTKQWGYFILDPSPLGHRNLSVLRSSGPSVTEPGDSGGPLFGKARAGARYSVELIGVTFGSGSSFTSLRNIHNWVMEPERMNVFWPEVQSGQLVNRAHGTCLQRTRNPLKFLHYHCLFPSSNSVETWKIIPAQGDLPNRYNIVSYMDMKCLDNEQGEILMKDCQLSSPTQRWVIEPADSEGTIQLQNETNGLCASAREYAQGQPENLYIFELDDCTPRPGNRWRFL